MSSLQEKLCIAAAELLMRLFESEYLTTHEEIALSDEELLHLSKLTLNQQRQLIDHGYHFLSVAIDAKSLRRKLNDIALMSDTHELEDQFLLLGAPHVLMRRLFGMHASEFSRRRQMLSIGGSGTGRPRTCSEQTEHIIWYQWQKYENLDERERFLRVAESTGEDLHAIWSALRDHLEK